MFSFPMLCFSLLNKLLYFFIIKVGPMLRSLSVLCVLRASACLLSFRALPWVDERCNTTCLISKSAAPPANLKPNLQ